MTGLCLKVGIYANTNKKIDAFQETPSPNDEYENFVNANLEAAAECIPTEQTAKPRFPWET